MRKSAKRAKHFVTDRSESNATDIRREARLLSNRLKIPITAALEFAKIRAAKRREKLRGHDLRAVAYPAAQVGLYDVPARHRPEGDQQPATGEGNRHHAEIGMVSAAPAARGVRFQIREARLHTPLRAMGEKSFARAA